MKDKNDGDMIFGNEEVIYTGTAMQFYDELAYLLEGMIKLNVRIRLIEFTTGNGMVSHAIRINRWRNEGIEGYWNYYDMIYRADSEAWEVKQIKDIIRDNSERIEVCRVKVKGDALRDYLDEKSFPSRLLARSR